VKRHNHNFQKANRLADLLQRKMQKKHGRQMVGARKEDCWRATGLEGFGREEKMLEWYKNEQA
jgi:hypothetical protein